jgi:hypothetical protein
MALISSGCGIGVAVGIGVCMAVSVGGCVGRGDAVEEGTTASVEEEAGSAVPQALIVIVNTKNINR